MSVIVASEERSVVMKVRAKYEDFVKVYLKSHLSNLYNFHTFFTLGFYTDMLKLKLNETKGNLQ